LLLRNDPEAVIGLFPSDHVIGDEKRYRGTMSRGVEIATAGENVVVLGVRPTRAETGYGYIEAGGESTGHARRVRRFTEKPDGQSAGEFVGAGNFFLKRGLFFLGAH